MSFVFLLTLHIKNQTSKCCAGLPNFLLDLASKGIETIFSDAIEGGLKIVVPRKRLSTAGVVGLEIF